MVLLSECAAGCSVKVGLHGACPGRVGQAQGTGIRSTWNLELGIWQWQRMICCQSTAAQQVDHRVIDRA